MARWVAWPTVLGAVFGASLAWGVGLLVPPPAAAQSAEPFSETDWKTAWKDLEKRLGQKNFESDLEAFANRATSTLDLVADPAAELLGMLKGDFLAALEKVFAAKGKVNDGSCRAAVAKYLLMLDKKQHERKRCADLLLKALETHRGCSDLAKAAYAKLAEAATDAARPKAERHDLRKRLLDVAKDVIEKTPAQMGLVFDALRILSGEESVRLIAVTALKAAKKGKDTRPFEEIARALGETEGWKGQPYLAIRIPALLELGAMPFPKDVPIQALCHDKLKLLTYREFDLFGQYPKWWKELTKRLKDKEQKNPVDVEDPAKAGDADGQLLSDALTERRTKAAKDKRMKDFATAFETDLGKWDGPDYAWVSPVLIAAFRWPEPELMQLRGRVILALRIIRPPGAVDELMTIASADPDPVTRAAAITTVGELAAENDPRAVPKFREFLRGADKTLRHAAAVALGRLRATDALEELIGYAETGAAVGLQQREAWVAVARVAGDVAVKALLKRLGEAGMADKTSVIPALGLLPLPLPDGVAEALLLLWAEVQGGKVPKAVKDTVVLELVDAFLGGRYEAGPAEVKPKTHRGVGSPKFLTELKKIALEVAKDMESHGRTVLRVLAEGSEAKDIADVMFDAFNLADPERQGIALEWIRKHPDTAHRGRYVEVIKDTKRSIEHRIEMVKLAGRAPVWDPKEVFDALLEVLQKEGDTDDNAKIKLVSAIIEVMREHPAKKRIPAIAALMKSGPEAPAHYLTLALHSLLNAWVQRSNLAGKFPSVRDRRAVDNWWKDAGKALEITGDEG